MGDLATSNVARARARLALRAERAFGGRGVAGVDLSALHAARAVPKGSVVAPQSRPETKTASPATPDPLPAPPVTDLFGATPQAAASSSGGEVFADPPPPRARRIELLQALDANEVTGCTKCDLHKTRTQTVFGEGDPEARLVFVGEGPGQNEDETGRPFVGKAGGLLDKMIAGMGLSREQVYISNVVKCRPPNNRTPLAGEVATCTPYLHQQLDWIRPTVIVPLGLPATRYLLDSKLAMGKLRGRWHEWRGIKVMPTYHPAYLLRSYTAENRALVWGDLKLVMAELGLSKPKAGGGR